VLQAIPPGFFTTRLPSVPACLLTCFSSSCGFGACLAEVFSSWTLLLPNQPDQKAFVPSQVVLLVPPTYFSVVLLCYSVRRAHASSFCSLKSRRQPVDAHQNSHALPHHLSANFTNPCPQSFPPENASVPTFLIWPKNNTKLCLLSMRIFTCPTGHLTFTFSSSPPSLCLPLAELFLWVNLCSLLPPESLHSFVFLSPCIQAFVHRTNVRPQCLWIHPTPVSFSVVAYNIGSRSKDISARSFPQIPL